MKIQTKELTGAALDWVVAKCLGQDEVLVVRLRNRPQTNARNHQRLALHRQHLPDLRQ